MAKDYIKIQSLMDLKYDKGNIVISYKYNHKTYRHNLLKIDESLFLPKIQALKYDDSFSLEECESTVKSLEARISILHKAITNVSKKLKEGESIKKPMVEEEVARIQNIVVTPKGFLSDFKSWIDDFKEGKKKEDILKGLKPRNPHPTVKDYTSAYHLLQDFEHDNFDRPIQLNDFDKSLISKLIEYCWDERPLEDDGYKYKTEGDLSNKTINKRLDSIFTFIDKHYKTRPNEIVKPKLETLSRKIIRLSLPELKQWEQISTNDPRVEKVRDYFTFLCYTGLRFSDFCRLDDTFYDRDTNEIVIKATKTSADCRIFLFDKAKSIGEKYNFKFSDYTNQGLNRAIHEICHQYELFEEIITMEYMQEGRQTYEAKKSDLLTCHCGRRTYISIMVENGLDLYSLMSTTGHKKIDTLKFYIDRFGPNRRQKFEDINEKISNGKE